MRREPPQPGNWPRWSGNGLSLSFSRYNSNFDANAQGVEALLTHTVKVQFPDLHEQFRNERALTIMASKLGEVLEIEAADSYIKRPAGPMVTIEVKDIVKLAGHIRIPSMAEGVAFTNPIRQKILYSGLPNQCRKCRRFGHQARACNIIKNSTQEGAAHHTPVPSGTDSDTLPSHGGETPNSKYPSTRLAHTIAPRARAQDPIVASSRDPQVVGKYQGRTESKLPRNRTTAPPLSINPTKNRSSCQSTDPGQRNATTGAQVNQSMAEPLPSPNRAKEETRAEVEKPSEEAMTPKPNLFFELPELNCPQAQKSEAAVNPFANSEEGSRGGDMRARCQEDTTEGWSFQGRKKHIPKLASPRPKMRQGLPRTPQQDPTSGGKRAQFHSKVHPSYFSSLGIDTPSNGEPFRARIWPVLTREKNASQETLVYSKNQAQSSLPLNMRITGPTEAVWTQDTAWADLTQRLETELEEKALRAVHSEHQENKNRSASIQASPQAARKKRYTKLNFATLASPRANGDEDFSLDREKEDDSQLGPARVDIREPGSFSVKAARSRLNYA
ncbi:unnamed protein product [Sphagnum jensenii]|uniref:CCHC-type domain-containing protein n=1 Tax=Sphagnum jensenii TaxID=128206 RepID=A0ABP0WYF1_9BRYO